MNRRGLKRFDPNVLFGFAAATIAARVPSLWRVASKRGRNVVLVQVALVALLLKQKSQKTMELVERIPKVIIPSAVLSALAVDIFASVFQKGPMETTARRALWFALSVGMIPNIAEVAAGGWTSITSGETDIPAIIAMQLGLCLNQVRAAAVILFMLTGGEAFEEYALHHAGDALHTLLHQSPGIAHLSRDGRTDGSAGIEDTPTETLRAGDVMLVKQGEVVPLDGVILRTAVNTQHNDSQLVLVDESLLTGEGMQVSKCPGEHVYGGSRNKGQPFWIKSSGTYSDSVMALMQAKLSEALECKGNMELESKKFVAAFTPITFAMAALSCLVSDVRRSSARRLWESVLSVFMSATPCPAGIGVPIAMLSGMSVASRRFGATIKSGTAFEALAKTSVVVLDKTGTVTDGKATVVSFECDKQSSISAEKTLQLVASVEQFSSHPLGEAVCIYYRSVGGADTRLLPVDNVSQSDGRGIHGVVDKLEVFVGAHSFCFPDEEEEFLRSTGETLEAFFCVKDLTSGSRIAIGRFSFEDRIRMSARQLIPRLQNELGLRVIMLSGDRSNHLSKVAAELGIAEFERCWPHEKADRVKLLREEGNVVLMVGDGANDSAALAAADVGMSVGALNLASESASVVLMNEDLENVAKLIATSRKVVEIAKKTVYYGMSASLLQMSIAALGLSTPFLSAVGQEGIDLGAVLHALRALSL